MTLYNKENNERWVREHLNEIAARFGGASGTHKGTITGSFVDDASIVDIVDQDGSEHTFRNVIKVTVESIDPNVKITKAEKNFVEQDPSKDKSKIVRQVRIYRVNDHNETIEDEKTVEGTFDSSRH